MIYHPQNYYFAFSFVAFCAGWIMTFCLSKFEDPDFTFMGYLYIIGMNFIGTVCFLSGVFA